jgi:hypothetical protein
MTSSRRAREEGRAVSAVVDGTALSPDLTGDVLDELQRALRAVSSELADPNALADEDLVGRLLRHARLEMDASRHAEIGAPSRTPEETEALTRALEALARALTGPPVERYRFASTTQPGVEYELTIDGADVICNPAAVARTSEGSAATRAIWG